MLRFVNICLVLGLVALAYVIYQVKYEARALDEEIASLDKEIDTERDALAVLRAEWSLLNRPERIERLAAEISEARSSPAPPARHGRQRERIAISPVSASRSPTTTPAESADDGAAGRQGRRQGPDHAWGGHAAGDAGTSRAAWPASQSCHPASSRRPVDPDPCATPPNQMPPQLAPSGPISRAAVIASASPVLPSLSAFVLIGGRLVSLGFAGDEPGSGSLHDISSTVHRPDILDRRGRLLATDIKGATLYADPAKVIDRGRTGRAGDERAPRPQRR